MTHTLKTGLILAPALVFAACSGSTGNTSANKEAKFSSFSAEGQKTAKQIQAKLTKDCTTLIAENADDTASLWNVEADKADAFCDCTTTKVVSRIPETELEKALGDIKRARGIPMLPMTVFARFGDDAKTEVEACK